MECLRPLASSSNKLSSLSWFSHYWYCFGTTSQILVLIEGFFSIFFQGAMKTFSVSV